MGYAKATTETQAYVMTGQTGMSRAGLDCVLRLLVVVSNVFRATVIAHCVGSASVWLRIQS